MNRIFVFTLSLLIIGSAQVSFSQENKKTAQGQKTGYWIVFGDTKPEKGHCATCKVEEGEYVNNRKEDKWSKYYTDGLIPRLIAYYKGGKPNGKYEKYHENGTLKEQGTYHERKQSGDFVIQNADGIITQKKTFNANGKEDGLVQFFYEDGSLQMEMTKKDGIIQGTATTYFPNGDVKKEIAYDASGKPGTPVNKDRVNPEKGIKVEKGNGGPSGQAGIIKDGKKYTRDGYNKLYNSDDELWMDGEFKSGKLWNGELYKYDLDGILLKIEVWKNGAYHSDGVLE
ncbi:MAG: antitoxin component YwqK of YwqJK toxin-antitoxin module [Arenicella sp.]|jgi:antitoxin component YwqK of YwqJK toxin-antitoxin module